ncbi:MAG: CotH kinase family protein [Myxococcales bacterium]|nr:CotH kinase family protein [Myxococcales bacterium]
MCTRTRTLCVLAPILCTLAGCAAELEEPKEPKVFGAGNVTSVDLTMAPADWDKLRFASPGLDFLVAKSCPPGPRPKPFKWLPATLKLNGGEPIDVLVRKKGWLGSMDVVKPSLKVKRVDGKPIAGQSRLTLNNNKSDKAHMKQCLTYKLFGDAGLPAPECGWAAVQLNGTKLGVYTHLESIKRGFLKRAFGDDTGHLYEGQLTDFRSPQLRMFEPKNKDTDPDRGPIKAVATALLTPGAAVMDTVSKVVDVEAFLAYWSMEVITGFWDGYSGNLNNYYVYKDPADQLLKFIPWGADETFGREFDWADGHLGERGDLPSSVYAHGFLANRIYGDATGRKRYEAKLRGLLKDVWKEDEIEKWIDSVEKLVVPHLLATEVESHAGRVKKLRDFVTGRRAKIIGELDAGLVDWKRGMRMITCAENKRVVTGWFETPWQSLSKDVLVTGTGELTEELSGKKSKHSFVRALGGPIQGGKGARFQVGYGPLAGGKFGFMQLEMPMELVKPGTVKLDAGQGLGEFAFVDASSFDAEPVGFVITGSVTFEKVDLTEGTKLRATVNAPVSSLVWDTSDPMKTK